ncbi:MAG: 50S ribosomal protein L32 [Candidatus Melainabacteria bacterium]|nr:MAG: 50S ribosomal protein L32 [Candidatus Melainabacteria bacterium]
MAVPKKRTGKSKQGHRRSNWKASKVEVTTCQNCGSLVPTHTVCTACGTYKGKVVSIKADGFKEEVVVEEKVQEEVKEEENNIEASNSDEKKQNSKINDL